MPSPPGNRKNVNKFRYLKTKLIKKIAEVNEVSNTFVKIKILKDDREILHNRLEEIEGPTTANLDLRRTILSNEIIEIAFIYGYLYPAS